MAISMFDDKGHTRIAKSKSELKNDMKVELSQRHTTVSTSFLDGCAVLWTISWPASGSVRTSWMLSEPTSSTPGRQMSTLSLTGG